MKKLVSAILLVPLLLGSCCKVVPQIEPNICCPPHPKETQRALGCARGVPHGFSCSPFPSLSAEEQMTDWGKEYYLALCFAADFDLYRAITGFKRTLWLLPCDHPRRLEVEYSVALAYFLGQKYLDAICSIETTALVAVDGSFAAWEDLLLVLFESYTQVGRPEHAAHILALIEQQDSCVAAKLSLLSAVRTANFGALIEIGANDPQREYLNNILIGYSHEMKSITKAQTLNALLPGAGYWYLGMKNTAVTALLVNSLFIAATAYFFDSGNWAAGAITLSLEGGWYFGGINGAGLAAKYYNEQLFCKYAEKIAFRENYFPLFLINYSF